MSRVEGVLQYFLHDARRSLNDFAGGDLIHDGGCEASDGHGLNPKGETGSNSCFGSFTDMIHTISSNQKRRLDRR